MNSRFVIAVASLGLITMAESTLAAPVELGQVHWGRDLEAARTASARSRRPVLLFFQEVPDRAAISADPTDALSYLYLGSALQDTGKWKDGIEAYSDCVRNATKGPVYECRAMGGKK